MPTQTTTETENPFAKELEQEEARRRRLQSILGISDNIHAWLDILPEGHHLRDQLAEASFLCRNSFVPVHVQNKPMECLFLIQKGKELGLSPTNALQQLYMTPDGKTGMETNAVRSLLFSKGFKITYGECSEESASVTVTRPDGLSEYTATWTTKDATRAKLEGKFNWKAYPKQMLTHRALMDAARAVAADVLGGIYSLEELGDTGEIPTKPDPATVHADNAKASAEIQESDIPLTWQQGFKERANTAGVPMSQALDAMRLAISESDAAQLTGSSKTQFVKLMLQKQLKQWEEKAATRKAKKAKPDKLVPIKKEDFGENPWMEGEAEPPADAAADDEPPAEPSGEEWDWDEQLGGGE